jgi:peptidoglycan/LPS O-acetylase OafA/YrhL
MEQNTKAEHNVHVKYRPDIDGLRAIAIISVVIFHAFPAKLRGGFVGVDIFFVISGFLISSIILRSLQRGDFSFPEFYAHRVKRILPALIVMLTATYVFGWFALLPDEFAQLGNHIFTSASFVQNIALFREAGYFDIASELKPLMHLWSLAIEEQFYLIFPLLIWAAWRIGLNVLTLIILLALISFTLNIHGIEKNAVKTFFLSQFRFWELLAGAILAYTQAFKQQQLSNILQRVFFHPLVFRTPPKPPHREQVLNNALSIIGFTLLVVSLITIHKGRLFPGWWALAPVSGTFLLIMAGPGAWVNRIILANRAMVFVGLISYPLYLWHWPILTFVRIMHFGEPTAGDIWAAVAASTLLAWLTYRIVEKPIRFGKRNTWKMTAGALAILGLVGLTGLITFKNNGLEFRNGMQALGVKVKDLSWNVTTLNYAKCDRYLTEEEPKVDNCSISKNGTQPTIAILGDSHADSIFHGIVKNDGRSWLLVSNNNCPPIIDVSAHSRIRDCESVVKKSVDYVANSKSIDTVVISFYGNFALNKIYAADHVAKGKELDRSKLSSNLELSSDAMELFYFGLEKTVSQLEKAGKKVLLTVDTPELPFFPRNCIGRPLVAKTIDCVIARTEVDDRQAMHREQIKRLVTAHPGVKVFDPVGFLCDETLCHASMDGVTIYRDSHHLSLRGSDLYGKSFMVWMNSLGEIAAH